MYNKLNIQGTFVGAFSMTQQIWGAEHSYEHKRKKKRSVFLL